MCRRRYRSATGLAALVLAASALGARAQTASEALAERSLVRWLELAAIHTWELHDGPVASWGSMTTTADGRSRRTPAAPVLAVVSRTIPDLWQLWIGEGERLDEIQVHYEVTSSEGNADRLGSPGGGEIEVSLRPEPPEIVRSEGELLLIQGGATLLLDLARAQSAGSYGGSISVTVTRP